MRIANCFQCGEVFDLEPSHPKRFCSKKCAAYYQWPSCPVCDKKFRRHTGPPGTPPKKYCSERCRLKIANKRYYSQPDIRVKKTQYVRDWRERHRQEHKAKRVAARERLARMFKSEV